MPAGETTADIAAAGGAGRIAAGCVYFGQRASRGFVYLRRDWPNADGDAGRRGERNDLFVFREHDDSDGPGGKPEDFYDR